MKYRFGQIEDDLKRTFELVGVSSTIDLEMKQIDDDGSYSIFWDFGGSHIMIVVRTAETYDIGEAYKLGCRICDMLGLHNNGLLEGSVLLGVADNTWRVDTYGNTLALRGEFKFTENINAAIYIRDIVSVHHKVVKREKQNVEYDVEAEDKRQLEFNVNETAEVSE